MEKPQTQHLYHMVPESIKPDLNGRYVIYPLNALKEKLPSLYESNLEKYSHNEFRKEIPKRPIPTLKDTTWGDVVQLTGVRPHDLRTALSEAGFQRKEIKFYRIDPSSLNLNNLTIYLCRDEYAATSTQNFCEYNPKHHSQISTIPEKTKHYFKQSFLERKRPFLFHGVPHIFHKGPIDVTDCLIITV